MVALQPLPCGEHGDWQPCSWHCHFLPFFGKVVSVSQNTAAPCLAPPCRCAHTPLFLSLLPAHEGDREGGTTAESKQTPKWGSEIQLQQPSIPKSKRLQSPSCALQGQCGPKHLQGGAGAWPVPSLPASLIACFLNNRLPCCPPPRPPKA